MDHSDTEASNQAVGNEPVRDREHKGANKGSHQSTATNETPYLQNVAEGQKTSLDLCCQATVNLHAENNPMMVCGDCKQIIKCFDNEKGFRNYQRFCHSRHRSMVATYFNKWWVVVFRSYNSYSS